MNNSLVNAIKEIVARHGETVLCEPRRISALRFKEPKHG